METVTELINKSPDTGTQTHAHSARSIHKIAGNPLQPEGGQLGTLGLNALPIFSTSEFSMFQWPF